MIVYSKAQGQYQEVEGSGLQSIYRRSLCDLGVVPIELVEFDAEIHDEHIVLGHQSRVARNLNKT